MLPSTAGRKCCYPRIAKGRFPRTAKRHGNTGGLNFMLAFLGKQSAANPGERPMPPPCVRGPRPQGPLFWDRKPLLSPYRASRAGRSASGFGLASLRPRASRWLRVQAFLPHLFAHRLLRVSAPSYWMSGLAHRPALQMKPAFVGFGSRRQHPVLIHSASSFLTKSNTQRTASRTLTTF